VSLLHKTPRGRNVGAGFLTFSEMLKRAKTAAAIAKPIDGRRLGEQSEALCRKSRAMVI
jgi:hypothetical protein